MTQKRAPRHSCARCGKRGTAEQLIYSRHTGSRYCQDLGACAARAQRLLRQRPTEIFTKGETT